MGKTVYSLVLSREVVEAIDELAARQGSSRSALVNHILAEYASITSPQRQAGLIFEALRSQAEEFGLRTQAATAGSLTLRTALSYKYNPAISYTVELYGEQEALGRLRVALRSQNSELLSYFANFFELWAALESKHLPSPPGENGYQMEKRRYSRVLRKTEDEELGEGTGRRIAAYVASMDACLKTFLRNCGDATRAVGETEKRFLNGLDTCGNRL